MRVVERIVCGYGPTRRLEAETWSHLQPQSAAPLVPLRVIHDQIGRGYGHATDAGLAAMERAAEVGLMLEPTYTAKAMAALLADAESGKLDGKRVLFVSTYGGPTPS